MFEETAPVKDDGLIRLPEWPQSERLAHEKELLGFYISSHPLTEHQSAMEWAAAKAPG